MQKTKAKQAYCQ